MNVVIPVCGWIGPDPCMVFHGLAKHAPSSFSLGRRRAGIFPRYHNDQMLIRAIVAGGDRCRISGILGHSYQTMALVIEQLCTAWARKRMIFFLLDNPDNLDLARNCYFTKILIQTTYILIVIASVGNFIYTILTSWRYSVVF